MENTTKFRGDEALHLQESFSFSSFDFNSSIGIFSDDDDHDHDDDDAYIEIALEPTPPPPPAAVLEEEEVNFPAGFSSSSPNGLRSSAADCGGGGGGDECAVEWGPTAPAGSEVPRIQRCNGRRRVGFPAVNRMVEVFVLSLKGSSSSSGMANQSGRQPPSSKTNWGLLRSRKASTKASSTGGGMRKFLVKFRSIRILSMMASFVKSKPRQLLSPTNSNNSSSSTQYNRRRTSDEAIALPNHAHRESTNNGNSEKSRVVEINLDAITRVLEAISKNMIARKPKQTKSCPGSIKASPIHQGVPSEKTKIYARDNSIQAAIVHCKQSYGQNK